MYSKVKSNEMKPYQQSIEELVARYQTDEILGLSQEQAERRLQEQGPNILTEEKPETWLLIFLRQFKSPLIFILLLAAAIIFLLHQILWTHLLLVGLFFLMQL